MTVPAPVAPESVERQPSPLRSWARGPVGRLVLRWAFIGAMTGLAFHRSLAELMRATRGESLNGYIWMLFAACVLAAVGIARRERHELPIHDRQTDIIAGGMVLGMALLMHGVLLPRYSLYYPLLRLDLVAMWLFVLGSAIVMFGLRPIIRYVWVWAMPALVMPLPYHASVVLLGNTRWADAVAAAPITMWAAWICTKRTPRRGMIGAAGALVVTVAVATVMALAVPTAPLILYQTIPPLAALVGTAAAMFIHARQTESVRFIESRVEPLATRQAWLAVPMVAAVAVLLSFVRLPIEIRPSEIALPSGAFGRPLVVPAGWHQTDVRDYPKVAGLYGDDSRFIRQTIVADSGNLQWDKRAAPRRIWIDAVSTDRPETLNVYPSLTLYPLPRARMSAPHVVDLGSGVVAQAYSITDDGSLVTWNVVMWTWRAGAAAQRVMVFAVDNHDDTAPVPEPGHSIPAVLRSIVNVLFRGNAAVTNANAQYKDVEMLTEVSRKLVVAQLDSLADAR